ncbi:hypothetical protein F383_21533 [Gossypium arboreum]|uniref:Uncharacterized protein n=1 Tax=Gossypium arboreum TaxID=29729 RepID=A0A0B0NZK7_GOSAR|nr:hypothetical protein F383_21533 [Gossypium arboreum]
MEQWTFGLSPACIKYRMSAFDVPEVMAVTRSNICKNGIQALSRRVIHTIPHQRDGDLEVFTLAVDKVPREWMLDSDWDME